MKNTDETGLLAILVPLLPIKARASTSLCLSTSVARLEVAKLNHCDFVGDV
jgi:hypothetical protein